jgi:type IV secretory pathway protease TraF
VLEPVRMTDDSMNPALSDGDMAFIGKLVYGVRVPGAGAMLAEWAQPQKGDLVVASAVGDPPATMLRRIAALPGEKVKLPDGTDLEMKAGEYYLLADKAEGTMDSRKIGPIPRRAIIGRVAYVWNGASSAKNSSPASDSRLESPKPKQE